MTVGSICSGIESATVALKGQGYEFKWYSEIAEYQSKLLEERYKRTPNLGNLQNISKLLEEGKIEATDMICGGTPCQAFSVSGYRKGLEDERGNLTLKFVEIIEANDKVRLSQGKSRTLVLWENVVGVISDKNNAFGCFISALAGVEEIRTKLPRAGVLKGSKRNVAWRVLDAKYFGVPQQRKRVYVIASDKGINPEGILFEKYTKELEEYPKYELTFCKRDHHYEVFRGYTDCLCSSYGTKWNGNASSVNGSLYVVQDGRLRRFTPRECERLMGFEDDYTYIEGCSRTNRYKGLGNAWCVPVIKWIGNRIKHQSSLSIEEDYKDLEGILEYKGVKLNGTEQPNESIFKSIEEIVEEEVDERLYISKVGCYGILSRNKRNNAKMPKRLEELLEETVEGITEEEKNKSNLHKKGVKNDK